MSVCLSVGKSLLSILAGAALVTLTALYRTVLARLWIRPGVDKHCGALHRQLGHGGPSANIYAALLQNQSFESEDMKPHCLTGSGGGHGVSVYRCTLPSGGRGPHCSDTAPSLARCNKHRRYKQISHLHCHTGRQEAVEKTYSSL